MLPQSDYWGLAQIIGQLILEVPDPRGGTVTSGVCTATAISSTLILTARHCFFDQTDAPAPYIRAHLRLGPEHSGRRLYELRRGFISEDRYNDVVLIAPEEQIPEFRPDLLRASEQLVRNSQDLFILHHPGPGSLVLTRMECRAADPATADSELRHECDTGPGSSGAPIFNGRFELVGVHLQGGRTESPGSYNRGVTIQALVASNAPLRALATATSRQETARRASHSVEIMYHTNFNAAFIRRSDAWFYAAGNDLDAATSLADLSRDGSEAWTFWDVTRDFIFEFPRNGGGLRGKPANGSRPWQNLGSVTFRRCPC